MAGFIFDTSGVRKAAQEHNAYTLDLWKDPDKGPLTPDNDERLLAVTFDLQLGRCAFAAAVHHFPGRQITLRDRARVILSSERAEHMEWARLVFADAGVSRRGALPSPRSR